MALTGEEISQIANAVASKVVARSAMVCSCENIEPAFLRFIEDGIHHVTAPSEFKVRDELLTELKEIGKQCGYEKDEKGEWVRFPKQEKALQGLGVQYEIIEEHDDGDLTIRIPAHNAKAVVTTEGEIFTKPD